MQFYNDMNHLEYKYTLLVSACNIRNFITGTYFVIIFKICFNIGKKFIVTIDWEIYSSILEYCNAYKYVLCVFNQGKAVTQY